MIQISISPNLTTKCSELKLGILECRVKNSVTCDMLIDEISKEEMNIKENYNFQNIKKIRPIEFTRKIYKTLGKDPNRYRPSTEAMFRRIIKGNNLYIISNVVDSINLVALKTGFSLGAFDADEIKGDIIAGIGEADETFEAIGRGSLNVKNLPILRDSEGAIGTPTSDVTRTAFRLDSTNLFININSYHGDEGLQYSLDLCKKFLLKYAHAENIATRIIE